MNKREIRFFTIADYEEEEIWLADQHRNGWKLIGMTVPCFYYFESCEPQDVIYRLDFQNNEQNEEYMRMLNDFGWEYVARCMGWLYFRKPAAQIDSIEEGELLSDNASKVEMIAKIIKTRMLPIFVLFFASVLPNFLRVLDGEFLGPLGTFFSLFVSLLFAVYIYLLIHCGSKLKKMKERYGSE